MKNKSFTLIELLVVIVIIGILAGVIIVSVSSSINKANFAKAQSFSNTVQNELLGDLVSEWTFDIASNPGEDTWGNNDGTVSGATYKTKADGVCVYGGCYEFDGTDDYIVIQDDASTRLKSLTLSAWVRGNAGSSNAPKIISKRVNSVFYFIGVISQKPYIGIGDGTARTFISSVVIDSTEWHFIVGTFSNSTSQVKIYVDGILEMLTIDGAVGDLTGNNVFIGGENVSGGAVQATNNFFNGLIDDVRIYNAAISSSQIKQQYVAGLDSLLSKNLISLEEYNEKINSLASN